MLIYFKKYTNLKIINNFTGITEGAANTKLKPIDTVLFYLFLFNI